MKKKQEIELEENQKIQIDNLWNSKTPPMIKDLVAKLFPFVDEKFRDGRSIYGKAIKKYLASKGKKASVTSIHIKKEYELDEEEREYIYNNCSTMKALDMARELFDESIAPLDCRYRAVSEYLKTIDGKVVLSEIIKEVSPSDYVPPKSEQKAIARINKYVHEGLDKNNIKASDRKSISKLIGYMHTYRFLHQISNYTSRKNRELFDMYSLK